MKTAVFALTENGCDLALTLAERNGWDIFIKRQPRQLDNINLTLIEGNFKSLVNEAFHQYQGIIFIMATGIVVRTLAPLIISKDSDPAIVVMDEKANNVISLLSGHLGGANELTQFLASQLDANPVITTSTDVNDVIAFDNFAKRNGLIIDFIGNIKYISDKMIHKEHVEFYSDLSIKGTLPANMEEIADFAAYHTDESGLLITYRSDYIALAKKSLALIPPVLVLGFGCRKGKTKAEIELAIEQFLAQHKIDKRAIYSMATIEVKAEEEGLLEYCESENMPLKIFTIEEVVTIEEQFTGSEFVKQTIGVKAVSAPCAYLLAGNDSKEIVGKTKCGGITLALYEKKLELKM